MANETSPGATLATTRERKLVAILSADVVGYSRLMSVDEAATLDTLAASRVVTDALIQQHRGRIVNTAGDSVLAEFASAVDAVQCAVDIQQALKTRNEELPSERKMEFRIGLNVGDVMVEGEQIYGDGVNVAARLQALADPGGIFLSGTVYDQVKTKLALRYEDLGRQTVKNITEPVRIYRVVLYEVSSPLVGEGQGEGAVREAESSRFKVQGG
jgi:adenylate cyclase